MEQDLAASASASQAGTPSVTEAGANRPEPYAAVQRQELVNQQVPPILAAAVAEDQRVSVWMRVNYDALVAWLGNGRADWSPVMRAVELHGLTDARGRRPPSLDTVYRTWVKVRALMAGKAATCTSSAERKPDEFASRVQVVRSDERSQSPAARRRLNLEPASLRCTGEAPPRTIVSGHAGGASAVRTEPKTGGLSRAIEKMRKRETPIPRPIGSKNGENR